MPSATFSLRPHHIEAIREVARRRRVSQSEVVRQALDLTLAQGMLLPFGAEIEAAGRKPYRYVSPALAPVIKELTAIRRELSNLQALVSRLETIQAGAADQLSGAASEANEPEPPAAEDS